LKVRFGNNHDKTIVCKKTLDPEWNARFVFEVEEDEIQEEPLQIRVLDHDTYSSHDAIGKVYIDLKPLLNSNGATSINGWFPIFDTMHGVRGEIKIQAKLEILNDFNEYKKSSCGVQFFSSSKVPEGYVLENYCGFVEELIINDDPEYQWIDKIRTPRTSNETRQKLFSTLSGELQRRIGLKVLEMEGNCVLGYLQNFDLEGEYGIVARGIGTCALITKVSQVNSQPNSETLSKSQNSTTMFTQTNMLKLNKLSPNRNLVRIHSDSDLNSFFNSQKHLQSHLNNFSAQEQQTEQPANYSNNRTIILEKMEYPFLTIQQYPSGFIKSISGIVCARSVKLLSLTSDADELDTRDKWWIEIRNEIRSHMKSLNCNVVLGYTETKSICESICVLSALGTAAVVDESFIMKKSNQTDSFDNSTTNEFNCKMLHVPYDENDLPFPVAISKCNTCGNGQVPDVVFTSIQPTQEIETIGKGCILRAIVTRPRKKSSNEISAKLISDYLPFMEYELHRQLLGKLKLRGMNMLYGLKVQISIGENMMFGIAEATACFAAALSVPMLPKIISEKTDKTVKEIEEINQLSKLLNEEMRKNQEFYDLDSTTNIENKNLDDENADLNLSESKGLFKIELDDVREKDSVFMLLDTLSRNRKGLFTCSTEFMPGVSNFVSNLQMFTCVYRCETSLMQMNSKMFNEICDEILERLRYKFRHIENCCLSNLSFDSSLYDDDHAMIILNGVCLVYDKNETTKSRRSSSKSRETTPTKKTASNCPNQEMFVEITNLSYVPNAQIEHYLGHINLFLIRESTQIKENGGLSGFMHCFINEVLALSRAHVLSLSGNALVSFKMNECILLDNPHRNQGQCLINISGDAVRLI
jgi:hypothetical protein